MSISLAIEPRALFASWARLWTSTASCVALLTLWSLALFLFGLDAGPLWRTEGLRALVAQEMLETGNWIVPRLFGEPLFTKPPGMYWLISLCSWPWGEVSPWSARIPSVLAGWMTVLVFFYLVKHFLGLGAALSAGILLPMSALWLDKAPSADIDMVQVAWITGSLAFMIRAVEGGERSAGAARWWYGAALCMAGGFLTKWTAPAFFYVTLIPWLWWRGQLKMLLNPHHLLGVLLAGLLGAAWMLAAITLEGWDIFFATIQQEALARIVPNYDPNYPFPWDKALLHPAKILIAALPGSCLALMTLRPGFLRLWDERGKFLLQAFHCWTWPNLLLWTCMSEHTPRHSFPLFPGLVGLACFAGLAWQQGKIALPKVSWRPLPVLATFMAIWLGVKVIYVHVVVPQRALSRQSQAKGQALADLVPARTTLYLLRQYHETLLYYYARPVRLISSVEKMPAGGWGLFSGPDAERFAGDLHVVQEMRDEMGKPLILVQRR